MENNSNAKFSHFITVELIVDNFSNFFMRKTTIIRNKIISDSPNYYLEYVYGCRYYV